MVLLVNEFPKSGGTWVVTVLGRYLAWSRADLYDLRPEPRPVDPRHPWYADAGEGPLVRPHDTVVKGHELPYSALLDDDAPVIHLVRNPLDVAVSLWFYESEFLPANELGAVPGFTRDQHLETTVARWSAFVSAWCATDAPLATYEGLRTGAVGPLDRALAALGFPSDEDSLRRALTEETPDATRSALGRRFGHNTFVRKATIGDWVNHIEPDQATRLLGLAAEGLDALGSADRAEASAPLREAFTDSLAAHGVPAP